MEELNHEIEGFFKLPLEEKRRRLVQVDELELLEPNISQTRGGRGHGLVATDELTGRET